MIQGKELVSMAFTGMAGGEESAPKSFGMKRAIKPGKKPGNSIAELNRLEEELSEREDKAKSLAEPDEALTVLLSQLGAELANMKKGKAEENALQRARELLSMIDGRLQEESTPIKELQRKIKKTMMEEIKPEEELEEGGIKMPERELKEGEAGSKIVKGNGPGENVEGGSEMAEEEVKKEEEKIKEAMQSKLREEEQKRKEEEAFKEAAEGEEFPEASAPEKAVEEPAVEEGYFEPEEKGEAPPELEKKPERPRPKPKAEKLETVNINRAESLYKSSLEQLLEAQLDNGAIVPTTPKKSYLQVYPRDHAFCTLALLKAGKFEEAKKALEFALKHQNRKEGCFPQRWDEAGNDTGYKPVQPDATALMLYALAEYVLAKNNLDFAEKNWDRIEKAVDFLNDKLVSDKNLIYSHSSIHEHPPLEGGYEIWTNAVCCAAFRQLSRVAEKIKVEYEPLAKENVLKDSMLEYMWNSRLNTFVKAIKTKESSSIAIGPDASVLALPFFEAFPFGDKRVKQTVKLVDEKLWHKSFGGISKFERIEGLEKGGFGASPFFTLLLADYYVNAGERERAEKFLNWVISTSPKGILPEHVSTKEDFEAFVSDFSDAGLLSKESMKLINETRSSPEFKNNVAHITGPFSMAHAAYIIAWLDYKEKFLK